jgi:SAM-dependent methyltransferase
MGLNYDPDTVRDFGSEWERFDQIDLDAEELLDIFETYFRPFPWHLLSDEAVGFDMGCGSGRWAKIVAPRVGRLYCIDASRKALETARKTLASIDRCEFFQASFDDLPFPDHTMDFGYALGVLHHCPDAAKGIKACVKKLKPGAPLLLYVYYAFDNRPLWFRWIWRLSDLMRRGISLWPFPLKYLITQAIAIFVYYPLAKAARLFDHLGFPVDAFPLSIYRNRGLYTMRTDALDRFGTRLENRFTRVHIRQMMEDAGLERIEFSDYPPYWCSIGYKKISDHPLPASSDRDAS